MVVPLYPFACVECGLEFDVSRDAGDLERAASCPIDGAKAQRVPELAPLERDDGSRVDRREIRRASWGSFVHGHGPGMPPHWHGPGTPFHTS